MVLSCLPEVCNNSPRAPDPSRVGRHTRQGCARELAVWDLPQQELDLANVAGTIVVGPEAREALGNSIQHHVLEAEVEDEMSPLPRPSVSS